MCLSSLGPWIGLVSVTLVSVDATVATRVPQGSMILLKLRVLLHLRCGSLTRTHTLLVWSPMKCLLCRRELSESSLAAQSAQDIPTSLILTHIILSLVGRSQGSLNPYTQLPLRKRWYKNYFEPSPLRPLLDAIRRLSFVVAGVHMVGSGRRCACA